MTHTFKVLASDVFLPTGTTLNLCVALQTVDVVNTAGCHFGGLWSCLGFIRAELRMYSMNYGKRTACRFKGGERGDLEHRFQSVSVIFTGFY